MNVLVLSFEVLIGIGVFLEVYLLSASYSDTLEARMALEGKVRIKRLNWSRLRWERLKK
jgi:hypothetical protein